MGYDFTPNEKNMSLLHDAVDSMEKKLEPFTVNMPGFKGVSLIIRGPNWAHSTEHDPFGSVWYDDYPSLVRDCELKLKFTITGTMLRKARAETYAKARMTQLPACCGVCVMNGVELHPSLRKSGLGKEFVRVVEAFARVLNYSFIMATTHKVNGPANGVVDCLGYSNAGNFVNMRTKNSVVVYTKVLNTYGVALTDGYLDLK
jgi:GNAT superfamily N-acetyltransferase